MDATTASILALPIYLIAAALYGISTNIARLSKAVEDKGKGEKPKLQV